MEQDFQDEPSMTRFFLESVRHNPALCTAFQRADGSIFVNAKIIGVGYVLKEKFMTDAIEDFKEHIRFGDELLRKAQNEAERQKAFRQYRKEGAALLLKFIYLEKVEAQERVDFARMTTIELAMSREHSSKHTWQAVQHNLNACLLFYQPPMISFEIHGRLGIHEDGVYHMFVNLVHDSFHYATPEKRGQRRPVYVFNVEEVYDNSAAQTGFGARMA